MLPGQLDLFTPKTQAQLDAIIAAGVSQYPLHVVIEAQREDIRRWYVAKAQERAAA